MLHPVGDLPAAVYWRRRLVVLTVLLALLAGAGWLTMALLGRGEADAAGADGTAAAGSPARTPGPERVAPDLAGVRIPDPGPATTAPGTPLSTAAATPTGRAPGSRCTDETIEPSVRAPAQVPAGSRPSPEIGVRDVAAVACARTVDEELRESVLLDGSDSALRARLDTTTSADRPIRLT